MIPGYPVNAEYANLKRYVEAAVPAAIGLAEIILAQSLTACMSLQGNRLNIIRSLGNILRIFFIGGMMKIRVET